VIWGSAGMKGIIGLDGMFRGPSIVRGRGAGLAVLDELAARGGWTPAEFTRSDDPALPEPSAAWIAPVSAAELPGMLAAPRDGYWHFERVHTLVLERGYACTDCHSSNVPMLEITTRLGRVAQSAVCDICHLAPAGTVAEGAQQRPLPPARD
jgi:hypothetical protein